LIPLGDPAFLDAAKEAADKAVTCGVEINVECSNYAIKLHTGRSDSTKVRFAARMQGRALLC
jgi:phosphopantetheinyl transferase (holo-ACP synthase)